MRIYLRQACVLTRSGENKTTDYIVARWSRDAFGDRVMRSGKRLLEVLLVQRRADSKWALPGGFVFPGHPHPMEKVKQA